MPSRDRAPTIDAWRAICFLLAVPVVFFFEQYIYEGFAVVVAGGAYVVIHGFAYVFGYAAQLLPDPDPNAGLGGILGGLALLLFFGAIYLALLLFFGAIALAIVVVLTPFGFITQFLASSPGPARHLLSLFFVWYVGLFFYGVLFPLLWRALEPWLAHTLAELTYQRARARVFGDRPRYRQPLYLLVASLAFGIVLGHVALNAGVVAAEVADVAWKERVTANLVPEPVLVFSVAPYATVPTGVQVGDRRVAVAFRTSNSVDFSVTASGPRATVARTTKEQSGWLWLKENGELYLHGLGWPATVYVYTLR